MPLFHFHLADHVREPDLEGTEFADAGAARVAAIVFAGAYLSDNPGLIDDNVDFRVEVADHEGAALFTVRIELIDQQRD